MWLLCLLRPNMPYCHSIHLQPDCLFHKALLLVILYCFQYDPDAKGYVVIATNVMKLGGVITIIVLAIFFGIMLTRERLKRRQAAAMPADPVGRGSKSHG